MRREERRLHDACVYPRARIVKTIVTSPTLNYNGRRIVLMPMRFSLPLASLAAFAFISCEIDEPPPVRPRPAAKYPSTAAQTQYPPQPQPFPQDPAAPPAPAPAPTDVPPTDPGPAPAPTAAATQAAKGDYPYAVPVPGKPGFVRSPYSPDKMTDVRGYAPGTEVKDPYTQKIFLVP